MYRRMVVNGVMSEKRFVPSKYASHTHDVKTDKHYYVTDEYVGCRELFYEIERLENENEQLRREKEYYRKYALLYLQSFDLYSDAFIETMRSIEGDEFAEEMLKDKEEIIEALKKEGLYE